MRKFVALGVLAVMAAGTQAVAAGFSYNLAEGQLLSGDNFDGLGVSGSFAFTPDYFGFGSIDAIEGDNSVDASVLSLGAGYHRAINPLLDVVATFSLKRAKIDGAGSDTGFGLGVGVRGLVIEKLELNGGLEYTDGIYDGSDTTLQVGGRWYFTKAFAAGLDLQDNDGGSTLRFAARYDFAPR